MNLDVSLSQNPKVVSKLFELFFLINLVLIWALIFALIFDFIWALNRTINIPYKFHKVHFCKYFKIKYYF